MKEDEKDGNAKAWGGEENLLKQKGLREAGVKGEGGGCQAEIIAAH